MVGEWTAYAFNPKLECNVSGSGSWVYESGFKLHVGLRV